MFLVSARVATWWPIQGFALFMVCTELYAYLALTYLLKTNFKMKL